MSYAVKSRFDLLLSRDFILFELNARGTEEFNRRRLNSAVWPTECIKGKTRQDGADRPREPWGNKYVIVALDAARKMSR